MGCNQKAQSAKPTTTADVHNPVIGDKTASIVKFDKGFRDSKKTPNSAFSSDCGWGYFSEEHLEKLLLNNLGFLYTEAVSELVELGYDEETALKAILRKGVWYGEGSYDVLTNILRNSLKYLNSGSCENDGESKESYYGFENLRQREEDSLESMIRCLQNFRPDLSRGDVMWCLVMSDLNVSRASIIEIPELPSLGSNVCSGKAKSDNEIRVSAGMCKCHGDCVLGNEANSEFSVNEFGGFFSYSKSSIERDTNCPKKLSLSPAMKSLLKRNIAAFAGGFHSKQQPCASSTAGTDPSEGNASTVNARSDKPVKESRDNNHDIVSSMLDKFQDLNLDDNLDCVAEDQKDELLLNLLGQVKDLEKQVKERKEWAHQRALQAAKRLTIDLTELKMLRTEREETQRLKKGKHTLEDATMKRLSDMETSLRKASSQVDRANAGVRRLEVENAEIRAEMEASKLSASESLKTSLEITKREKKCLKRLLNWEKQKAKLQDEIVAEKQKISEVQQKLVQMSEAQKEAEAKWWHEVKEKELAMCKVEAERRSKEATEGNNKRKLEALRLRIEMEFQRQKDDLQRLEQELSHLKSTAQSASPPSDTPLLNEPLEGPENESGCGRECMICLKDEVSVVFLPCAHQVMCGKCGEDYGNKKGRKKATCPCCRAPIEQRIRVFGASS